MRRLFVLAVLALVSFTASANSHSERVSTEWKKFEERGTNVCFGSGSLYFGYTPLDRRQFYPVVFSPTLQTDLLKRVASVIHLKDAEAQKLVAEDVNAALNQHIEELRNGTYNKIDVVLGKGNEFTVTPAESGGDDVLIWMPSGAGMRFLELIGGQKPTDSVYFLQSDGKFEPVGSSGPKWLRSHDLYTQTGANYRTERRHLKNYVDCK